jgi:uncharacterized membrane protein YfcA
VDWHIGYLILGAIVGLLGGLLGIGGGTILVPVLLFMFEAQHFPPQHAMHLALGTSMATILFTSISSMLKHHQHGAVNWRVVRDITPGILIGAALGTTFASQISAHSLGIFFVLFMYIVSAQILFDLQPNASRELPGKMGMTMVGTFTGWLCSLVSIGGGAVIVPFLIWCNVSLRHAIGTSAAIGFPVAAGGTIGYVLTGMANNPVLPEFSFGFVYLPALFWVALISVIMAPFGAKATHHMKVGTLRNLFALLQIALATKLLFKLLA